MEVTKDRIKQLDEDGMYDILTEFYHQIETGLNAGQAIDKKQYDYDNIVFCGIGGSAISGDILSSYLDSIGYNKQVYVNREYTLPNWANENTLVLVSSYSGNTEETLSAYEEATKITKNIICYTTGGKLGELAESRQHQVINLRKGMMPRCGLAMSFIAVLSSLVHLDIIPSNLDESIEQAIKDTYANLKNNSKTLSNINSNNAITLAKKLHKKKTVIYAGKLMYPVAKRWAGQIQENAKSHAYFNQIPEMNHNEINSWDYEANNKDLCIVLLKDKAEHPRVQKRMRIFTELVNQRATTFGFSSDGRYVLTRMFELIYFGDWVSYYLSIIRGVDPTPIPTITILKEKMAGKSPK
ncbi:MAG: bifunctional phosphoglucose/phosphomannose isomerase [Chlorobiota bacterium]